MYFCHLKNGPGKWFISALNFSVSELSIILHECLNYTADFQLLTILCQIKKEKTKGQNPPTIQRNAQGLLYLWRSFGGERASSPASSSPCCLVLGRARLPVDVSQRCMCYFQAENRQTPASAADTWTGWRWVITGIWSSPPVSQS